MPDCYTSFRFQALKYCLIFEKEKKKKRYMSTEHHKTRVAARYIYWKKILEIWFDLEILKHHEPSKPDFCGTKILFYGVVFMKFRAVKKSQVSDTEVFCEVKILSGWSWNWTA